MNIKRYLVYTFHPYERPDGWPCSSKLFATLDEAIEVAKDKGKYFVAEVVDLSTESVLLTFEAEANNYHQPERADGLLTYTRSCPCEIP